MAIRPLLARRSIAAVLVLVGAVGAVWFAELAQSSVATSPYVTRCGAGLCLRGQPFVIHGATAYGTYDEPTTEVRLAQRAHLNTIAIVEFALHHKNLQSVLSEATWVRVDRMIAAARHGGLHVVITLSEYAQALQLAGRTPTRVDWGPLLRFIARRVNTVTHVRYRDDPTIAMVQLWGEICYPGESDSTCPPGTSGTAADMSRFYHRSLTEWHALAPNILATTGGFSHLNAPNSSGIPWRAIMSDPANPICEIEINSANDVSGTVGKVTAYCKSIGKPWYLAAWSSCYQDPGYPFYTTDDRSMAAHARAMYAISRGGLPARKASVGSEFWNLRARAVSPGHCDIGPAFPLTFAAVQHG